MKLHKTEKLWGKKPTKEYTGAVMSSHDVAIQVSDLRGLLNPKMVPGAEVTGREIFFHLFE